MVLNNKLKPIALFGFLGSDKTAAINNNEYFIKKHRLLKTVAWHPCSDPAGGLAEI